MTVIHSIIDKNCYLTVDTLDLDVVIPILEKNNGLKYLINNQAIDVFASHDSIKICAVPVWVAAEYSKNLSWWDTPSTVDTKFCFNFCVNKKRINRHLLIKLVEFFNFKNYDYTWSGVGREFDMSPIIVEWDSKEIVDLTSDIKSFLLKPIESIEEKFYYDRIDPKKNDISVIRPGKTSDIWEYHLQYMFSSSAISLISEPIQYQKLAAVTEKTLLAIMGLTMPIWVGGYGIPDAMKKIGFDVFDDVINHDYQYKETLIERCFYSFFLNKHLLDNFDLARELRSKCLDRLRENFRLLKSGILDRYCKNIISTYPSNVQQLIENHWSDLRS